MLNWVLLVRSLVTLKLISLNLCTIKLRFNFKIYMFAHKIELQMVTKRMKINKHIFYKLIFIFIKITKNWINNSNYLNQLSIPKNLWSSWVELDSLYNKGCLCWKIYNANNWVRSRKSHNLTWPDSTLKHLYIF